MTLIESIEKWCTVRQGNIIKLRLGLISTPLNFNVIGHLYGVSSYSTATTYRRGVLNVQMHRPGFDPGIKNITGLSLNDLEMREYSTMERCPYRAVLQDIGFGGAVVDRFLLLIQCRGSLK